MITADFVRELFTHMEWADARMWAAMPSTAPPDDFLRNTLVHLHAVQRSFFLIWTGGQAVQAFRKPEEFPALADVRAWAQPHYGEARAFLESVTDAQLAQPIVMPWSAQIAQSLGHEPGVTTVGDTCFQVASHTTHHRGQINTRLRALGAEPPLVDYIVWLWHGRPAPQWK
jgi:uncharacterized damage-inducible protein DinB